MKLFLNCIYLFNSFKKYNQPDLFSFETELSKKQHDLLDVSKGKWFDKLILRNINQ